MCLAASTVGVPAGQNHDTGSAHSLMKTRVAIMGLNGAEPTRRRSVAGRVGRQNLERRRSAMLRRCSYSSGSCSRPSLASVRPRGDLVLENLLLRHQLGVLTRPTRTRRRAQLRTWDKLLWILARQRCAGWREHLAFVTPDTVVRWHRQGWRLF